MGDKVSALPGAALMMLSITTQPHQDCAGLGLSRGQTLAEMRFVKKLAWAATGLHTHSHDHSCATQQAWLKVCQCHAAQSCWLRLLCAGDMSIKLLVFLQAPAAASTAAKETPQERLKRLMQAQLNKAAQKDSLAVAQRKIQVCTCADPGSCCCCRRMLTLETLGSTGGCWGLYCVSLLAQCGKAVYALPLLC